MFIKISGMRVTAGAAAMAFALVAAGPAQAGIYKFTLSDQGTFIGSVNVDSNPTYHFYLDGIGSYAYYSVLSGSGTGFFKNNYSIFPNTDGQNILGLMAYYGSNNLSISTASESPNYSSDTSYIASIPDTNFIGNWNTPGASMNYFVPGVYSLSNSFGMNTAGDTLSSNLSLTISPVAPAPLAGGGILAGLVSLFGFGFTRFGRRRLALG